jgi:hypothetical protein
MTLLLRTAGVRPQRVRTVEALGGFPSHLRSEVAAGHRPARRIGSNRAAETPLGQDRRVIASWSAGRAFMMNTGSFSQSLAHDWPPNPFGSGAMI